MSRSTKKKRYLVYGLLIISLVGIAFSGCFIYQTLAERQEAIVINKTIHSYIPLPVPNNESFLSPYSPDVLAVAENFPTLKEKLPNLAGWLIIEDTPIDYPVMYPQDNNYYLTHAANDQPSTAGSLFLDCRNKEDFSDDNAIIHGHNIGGELMFGTLSRYKQLAYYKEHSTIYLVTEKGIQTYAIFSFYQTQAGSASYTKTVEQDLAGFIADLKANSIYDTQVDSTVPAPIITLSTCTNKDPLGRYVLHATLVKTDD